MTRKILTIALFFTLYITVLHAQKESYNWAFGVNAGLSWNTTQNFTGTAIPAFGTTANVSLTGIPTSWRSSIVTDEGCFSVSTADGEKMFYSNGATIWDKNNNPMPNGTGLLGHSSSAQSGIVIPYPGQGGKFIVFAVNCNKAGGLSYSVVDMSLNGGLGGVVAGQKNRPLTGTGGDFGESITAVRHANYRDYWMVATARNANNTGTLNVWKVDLNGVHTAAVSSVNTGGKFSSAWTGYMRFSKDGSKFWQGTGWSSNSYILARFDTATGVFSNVKIKTAPYTNPYGAEFSPNGRYVYATHIYGMSGSSAISKLYAWDFDALMSAANISTVAPLKELSYTGLQDMATGIINNLSSNHFGVPLMGPDNRMYVANAFTNSMFIIPAPDSNPAGLKIYKLNHILNRGGNEKNSWGLPTYAAMYFQLRLTSTSELICQKSPAGFRLSITGGEGAEVFSRYTLDWGDGSPVITNSSPQLNSTTDYTHVYNKMGDYTVTFNSYDTNNQIMLGSSSNAPVHVSNCFVPVNPHIRGRME